MSKAFVKIHSGSYRNQAVINETFPLIAQYKDGANGGFVTVNGASVFGEGKEKIRVKVSNNDFTYVTEFGIPTAHPLDDEDDTPAKATAASTVEIESTETDEEAMARIADRFNTLHELTGAAVAGDIRAMIVTGPPGIGKSFGVEQELDKAAIFDKIAGRSPRSEMVTGAATALGLYVMLYKYRDAGSTIVFDDCDTILWNEDALNLLKGALDSGKKRKISWLSDSNMLKREDVPNSFEFKGSAIFITNLKFDKVTSKKIGEHLQALMSRCHYLDLTINTTRDKLLRIRQIAKTGELFNGYGLSAEQEEEVLSFIEDNQKLMREISLRQAVKIADLVKSFPTKWQDFARKTCMKSV